MEGKSYEDRLRYLGLWTLDDRINRQDLILSRVRIDKLFMLYENMRGTRGHCLKLRKTRCTRDITRHFLISWSTDGTCMDQRTVDAPSLNAFKMVYLGLGITGWASSWTMNAKP